jgi:hypothetical protein
MSLSNQAMGRAFARILAVILLGTGAGLAPQLGAQD